MAEDKHERASLWVQIIFIISIIVVTLIFGLFPLFCKVCKNSTRFLGIANSFSGGIFMGIALFHLFPEVWIRILHSHMKTLKNTGKQIKIQNSNHIQTPFS